MIISTDAPVRYDAPIDYGFHKFCQQCQVCVARCPGRALVKEQVWYRGVEKNKLIYDRCRPVMVDYEGCAVCMKVCPVQKFGMQEVMEHYVETGEVLGKGTAELETYELRGKGSFGPGELPQFDRQFFEFPHGSKEDWLFQQLKEKLDDEGVPPAEDLEKFAGKVKDVMERQRNSRGDE
jgi:ferredoxin